MWVQLPSPGYDKDGQKMIKQLSSSAIDQLLAKDDPEGWRTVVDVKNNRKYRLTDTDLEVREDKNALTQPSGAPRSCHSYHKDIARQC